MSDLLSIDRNNLNIYLNGSYGRENEAERFFNVIPASGHLDLLKLNSVY